MENNSNLEKLVGKEIIKIGHIANVEKNVKEPVLMENNSENLKQFVGKEIIRIAPTAIGDWSYTDGPVLLVGFTPDGQMIYQHTGKEKQAWGNQERILSKYFSDDKWILYKEALTADDKNPLNKWMGKKIRRKRPAQMGNGISDYSYMDGKVVLIAASKHHICIEYDSKILGRMEPTILDPRYSIPEDWELVSD